MSEIVFWNATPYPDKLKIVALFPASDSARQDLSPVKSLDPLHLKFPVYRLRKATYSEVVGRRPAFSTRLIYDGANRFVFASMEEKNETGLKSTIETIEGLVAH